MKKIFWIFPCLLLAACGGVDGGLGDAQANDNAEIVTDTKQASTDVISVTSGTPQIAVNTGLVANGNTIDPPSGFTTAQCRFSASLASVSGSSLSTHVNVSAAGVVTCLQTLQEREEVPATTSGCTAAYTVICVK